jgi:tetratricopeptide (TPR) repeat protein
MPVLAPPAGGRSGIPARVNFQQGEALLEREHYQEALEEFEKGLEKDPKNVTAYINKGLAQHALGRLNDELHAYNQALAFDWTNVTAWQNKIVIRKRHRKNQPRVNGCQAAARTQFQAAVIGINRSILSTVVRQTTSPARVRCSILLGLSP